MPFDANAPSEPMGGTAVIDFDPSQPSEVVNSYETRLNPKQEEEFSAWKDRYAPNDSGQDYDFRGAFKAGLTPSENGHWPDTYKKPNHPTFSDESIYAKDRPELAGYWNGDNYTASDQHWSALFAGVDYAQKKMSPEQKAVFSRLTPTDTNADPHKQTINQAYAQWLLPNIDPGLIQKNWDAVRVSLAESSIGIKDPKITDASLYSAINDRVNHNLQQSWSTKTPWARLKMMFGSQGYGDNVSESASPAIGSEAAGTKGAIFTIPKAEGTGTLAGLMDASNKMVSVLSSVENTIIAIGTAGAGIVAELAAGTRAAVVARAAQAAAVGSFAVIGAKDTAHALAEAKLVFADPLATPAARSEAAATVVLSAAMTAAAAKGTYDFAKTGAGEAGEAGTENAKFQQVADNLRAEGEKLTKTNPEMAETLAAAADKVEAEAATPKTEETALKAEETAPPTEPKAAEELTGIKNEAVDAELADMGLEPSTHGEKLTMEQAVEDAKSKAEADPEAGSRLVSELESKPRPITGREDALLTHELNRIAVERDAADTDFAKVAGSGDETKISEAKGRVNKAVDDYRRTAEIATRVGTENAQGLALRRLMLKRDYSLAAMEKRLISDNEGKPLTAEQTSKIKDLSDRLRVAEKALEDYKAKRAEPKVYKSLTEKLTAKANEARERIKARMAEGRQQSGLDPEDIADHAIVGADYIAKGVKNFAEWSEAMLKEFGERIRPHLQTIFDQSSKVPAEEKRLEGMKKRTSKSIEGMKEKIAARDASEKPKPAPFHLDAEANRLRAEHEAIKQEYEAMRKSVQFQNMKPFQKVSTVAADLYDAARLVMTTGEFSFILRQGKMGVLAHPIMTAKALPDTLRALAADPVQAHAINLQVLGHPDIRFAKAAKLHLLDESASLNKQEEALMGKWVGKIPLIKRFNQAGVVFMNRLRFDWFQRMRQASGGLDAAEQKQVAMFINEATGRGSLGSFEPAAVNLSRAMFAPRYLASRIQVAVGHSLWGGDFRTRRAISGEYAKTLVALGLYYTGLEMALSTDDKKAVIGTDPRSSDFGKVKVGNTRLDPLAGLAQVIVFGARTATGERTTSKGHVVDIRGDHVPYGGDRWSDIAANFARSKLHPVPGAIINLFDGTDLAGNKVDVTNQALNMMAPLTYMDVYQALEEQDLPQGVALSLLTMLGEGLQTYDANKSHAKETPLRSP